MARVETVVAAMGAAWLAWVLPGANVSLALVGSVVLMGVVVRARRRALPGDDGLSFDTYEEFRERRHEFDDEVSVPGVYVMRNEATGRAYVGQSVNMARRVTEHFRGRDRTGGGRQAYVDHLRGDPFSVTFLELASSGFADLNEMEAFYIDRFDAVENGYNMTRGNASERGRRGRTRRKAAPRKGHAAARPLKHRL